MHLCPPLVDGVWASLERPACWSCFNLSVFPIMAVQSVNPVPDSLTAYTAMPAQNSPAFTSAVVILLSTFHIPESTVVRAAFEFY